MKNIESGPFSAQLELELRKVEPAARDAQSIFLGKYAALHYQIITPAYTFDVVVHVVSERRAIVIKARAGYSPEMARALIERSYEIEEAAFSSDTITELAGLIHPSYSFDSFVFLPPSVASCFPESKLLNSCCVWPFPAFKGEFLSGQGTKEYAFQIGRKDGYRIHVARWDRTYKTKPLWD